MRIELEVPPDITLHSLNRAEGRSWRAYTTCVGESSPMSTFQGAVGNTPQSALEAAAIMSRNRLAHSPKTGDVPLAIDLKDLGL